MIQLKLRSMCVLAAVAAPMLLMAGCQSDPENVSQRAIFRNLTPELRATHERPVDIRRNLAVNRNLNWRMFHDDLGRTFYTDHPSRLTGKPVFGTSGHHR